ncbi:MAG TPA: hypothetical protein VHH36_06805, partial [Candidatus Thermoplasmatota archaeon]|nr:hypothetical protein [Candidatus Thermoplasmatota archaeon]
KAAVKDVATAVYARKEDGRPAYDRVLVVGHSLGSVVSYDTLNALLAEDDLAERGEHAKGSLRVAQRTKLFLTFGSPLDKIAFVFATQSRRTSEAREALAALVQPMIQAYDETSTDEGRGKGYRTAIPWVNVHAPSDIVSGPLDLYDDPARAGGGRVVNDVDRAAVTPLASHNEYWKNERVWEVVRAHLPPQTS